MPVLLILHDDNGSQIGIDYRSREYHRNISYFTMGRQCIITRLMGLAMALNSHIWHAIQTKNPEYL